MRMSSREGTWGEINKGGEEENSRRRGRRGRKGDLGEGGGSKTKFGLRSRGSLKLAVNESGKKNPR